MSTNPLELYYAGQLQGAIAALNDQVKQRPTDASARGFLCELLCFAGDLARADRQLEALAHQDPESAVGYALFRQLVRAEQARQQFFTEGRLPDFLDPPCERMRLVLEASIHARENRPAEAARLLGEAQARLPSLSGTCDGQPFQGLRDLDDLTATVLEMLTAAGKYYLVPLERLESVEFHKPQRPRDVLWRKARVVVRDGPDVEVYLPAVYAGSHLEEDERLRLGQMTDWRGGEGAPVRGLGQRMLLVGEEDRPFLEFGRLTFHAPAGAPAGG